MGEGGIVVGIDVGRKVGAMVGAELHIVVDDDGTNPGRHAH